MFGSLKSMPLAEFIEQERADDHLWMFLHIPKTAGSSFGTELAKARSPYKNIHITYGETRDPIGGKMQEAVQNFIAELDGTRFRSCSGHFNVSHADMIAEKRPDSKLITFLRNPVNRVISDYRYQRTPAHPPYLSFIERHPTLESYVDSRESQNKMFRTMAGKPQMPVAEAIEYLDERYTFIGLVEMYPMCFNVIFRMFGENQMPSEYKRRTEPTPDNAVEITPELQRKIKQANAKDVAIYNHVRERLAAKREEWLAMRRARKAA